MLDRTVNHHEEVTSLDIRSVSLRDGLADAGTVPPPHSGNRKSEISNGKRSLPSLAIAHTTAFFARCRLERNGTFQKNSFQFQNVPFRTKMFHSVPKRLIHDTPACFGLRPQIRRDTASACRRTVPDPGHRSSHQHSRPVLPLFCRPVMSSPGGCAERCGNVHPKKTPTVHIYAHSCTAVHIPAHFEHPWSRFVHHAAHLCTRIVVHLRGSGQNLNFAVR
jgi:hypothetical protein